MLRRFKPAPNQGLPSTSTPSQLLDEGVEATYEPTSLGTSQTLGDRYFTAFEILLNLLA